MFFLNLELDKLNELEHIGNIVSFYTYIDNLGWLENYELILLYIWGNKSLGELMCYLWLMQAKGTSRDIAVWTNMSEY